MAHAYPEEGSPAYIYGCLEVYHAARSDMSVRGGGEAQDDFWAVSTKKPKKVKKRGVKEAIGTM